MPEATPIFASSSMRADVRSLERRRTLSSAAVLARNGDTGAFAQLVIALQPDVYRWALTYARDADDADEITQQTFVMVHRKLRQYRADSPIEGWVYRITRRIALQGKRRHKRRAWLSESALPGIENVYNTDPGGRVDRQRIADYIRAFFVELPPRQREVFDMVDLQGHDPAEVAEIIGLKQATVRANLFKARAAIRGHILAAHPAWREITG